MKYDEENYKSLRHRQNIIGSIKNNAENLYKGQILEKMKGRKLNQINLTMA
jgi:hypothetical protein